MDKEKERKLFSCKSISEFLAMFWGLSYEDKISVFTEKVIVPPKTEFYRIRKAKGFNNKNIADPKEWGPPPKELVKQGRFNAKHEPVLYVASDSYNLDREVKLEKGEKYYLAKYTCTKKFEVGTFLGTNSWVNLFLHKIAMSISGRNSLTDCENKLLDEYLVNKTFSSIQDFVDDNLLSFFLYRYYPDLYGATNKLWNFVKRTNRCGLRYASVFAPVELSGANVILTLDGEDKGNYALTEEGYKNLELVSVDEKVCGELYELETMISAFSEVSIKSRGEKYEEN